MSIQLIQAEIVLEVIWRLNSLCIYIGMETAVGTSTGVSVFISVFSAVIQTSKKKKK